MIQKPLSMIQNTLFVNLMTQNTLFMATIEKIITHALGEHYPGSASNRKTSSDFGALLFEARIFTLIGFAYQGTVWYFRII